MNILIVSNMDARQPYGAWTRPYYLGEALSNDEQVYQLGYDTSDVRYSPSVSVKSKSLLAYSQAIQRVCEEFNPDVIYAHETFPAVVAYMSVLSRRDQPLLVFDIHALHAAEYKAMVNYYDSRTRGRYLFYKSYYSQRFIVHRKRPIIAASSELKALLKQWYGVNGNNVRVVPNGAPQSLLSARNDSTNPYPPNFKIALIIAPKNMMPNELAVQFMLRVAKKIFSSSRGKDLLIVVIGGGWRKEELEVYPNLVYMGFVDELIAYIDHADICLLPYPREAVCGGARNKALDYFARGKCVLSTEEGIRGLSDFHPDQHVIISRDDPGFFADKLLNVVNNFEIYEQIGHNARKLVNAEFVWQKSAEKVRSFFSELI